MDKYSFSFKTAEEISESTKEAIYSLATNLYPDFQKYFTKNRYYSTVKPQLILLVYDNEKLIGYGKLLWRKLQISHKIIKLAACGFIVASHYQKRGIGTHMLSLVSEKAKDLQADVLYASTTNPNATKMLEEKGFARITTKLIYTEAFTKKIIEGKDPSFCLELTNGSCDQINSVPQFYLGIGPV